MAHLKSISLRRECNRIFPKKKLDALARETGAIQRQGKVKIVELFWTLILGFGGAGTRSLAGLRRCFGKTTGKGLVPSAFYYRFSPALATLMKRALMEVLTVVGRPQGAMAGCLSSFRDVVTTDSTVIRLHRLLQRKWPACRTNHTLAALKAHVVMSVKACGPSTLRITSERTHDGPVLRAGEWVRGKLMLFDLGYYRFQLFARIGACGGFFVSRLKDNANPLICAIHLKSRGRALDLVGQRLQDILASLKRKSLDVEVDLDFSRRAYLGVSRRDKIRCRLVGVRNEATGAYHLYLTNVPPETLVAEEIAKVYGARWLIELAFRELKSCFELDKMPSSKPHIVETLLYAAFITMVVSRSLLHAFRRRLSQVLALRCPEERWAAIFRTVATELLNVIMFPAREGAFLGARLLAMMRREIIDPNANRPLLIARVETFKPA